MRELRNSLVNLMEWFISRPKEKDRICPKCEYANCSIKYIAYKKNT